MHKCFLRSWPLSKRFPEPSTPSPSLPASQLEAEAGQEGVIAAAAVLALHAAAGKEQGSAAAECVGSRVQHNCLQLQTRGGSKAARQLSQPQKQRRCRQQRIQTHVPTARSPAAEAAHGHLRLPLVQTLHHHAVVARAVGADLRTPPEGGVDGCAARSQICCNTH